MFVIFFVVFILFDVCYMCGVVLFVLLKLCILIFDGVMGMMIQCYKFDEVVYCGECFKDFLCDIKGNNELLLFMQLQIICEIYDQYFVVGVDIVEINMFGVMIVVQVDYGMEDFVVEMNVVLVKFVCELVVKYVMLDKLCFVVGVIGLMLKMVSILLDVNDLGVCNVMFDELCMVYYQQVKVLFDGGVDLFFVEMIFDMLNVKVVLFVFDELFEDIGECLLIMILGIVIDVLGWILLGQIVEVFWNLLCYVKLFMFGLNCVFGVVLMCLYIVEFVKLCDIYVLCYLNVGLLNLMSDIGFDEIFDVMLGLLKEFVQVGFVNFVGGCCGMMFEYIVEIVKVFVGVKLCCWLNQYSDNV